MKPLIPAYAKAAAAPLNTKLGQNVCSSIILKSIFNPNTLPVMKHKLTKIHNFMFPSDIEVSFQTGIYTFSLEYILFERF